MRRHMEGIGGVLADEIDVGRVHPVADGQGTARALCVGRITQRHIAGEVDLTLISLTLISFDFLRSAGVGDVEAAFNALNPVNQLIYARLLVRHIFGGTRFIAPYAGNSDFHTIEPMLDIAELVPHFRVKCFNLVPHSAELLKDKVFYVLGHRLVSFSASPAF